MSTVRLSSEKRRAVIIDAAIALFAEHGFRGTTTRELAAHVGVSEPVLYQHFRTKRDLYQAIFEKLASGDEVVIPVADLDGPDDRQILTRLAHGIIEWHIHHPNYVRLLLRGAIEGAEVHEIFREHCVRDFVSQLKDYFARRIESGAFRAVDPEIASNTFVWMTAQFALELTLSKKPADSITLHTRTIDGMIDIFLKGILA